MLVPPSRNIAAMPFSVMRRRAFSMRARRSSSVIGGGGGPTGFSAAAAGVACDSETLGPMAAAPATAADRLRNVRRFMAGCEGKWWREKKGLTGVSPGGWRQDGVRAY